MLRLAKTALLLLIFTLPLMKLDVAVAGYEATLTDLLFLVAAAALALAVVTGRAKLRWNGLYIILLAYFTAMLLSAAVSADPLRSALKLATQAYLLSLPVLGYQLVDSLDDLRAAFRWWLAAAALTAATGAAAALSFVLGAGGWPLSFAIHEFGTLPPGNYVRLEATFDFPAMLCNYLAVSLMILLVSHRLGWLRGAPFHLLLAAILVVAALTLTPGLGGVALVLGLWLFAAYRERAPRLARAALGAGALAALLFVLAATVTPIIHPTAPFLIAVPGTEAQLAPAVRMMTWIDASTRFLQHPLLGVGIGNPAVAVAFVDPSGFRHFLTDAHNVFLNVAVQCGLAGLAALLILVWKVAAITGPLRLTGTNAVRLGLGLAWLSAFAYQGLTGSFEDARHLWVLLGLLLAADRLEAEGSGERRAAG